MMTILKLIVKGMKKNLKKRDFWFAVIVYPVLIFGYLASRDNKQLSDLVKSKNDVYFFGSFAVFAAIIIVVANEIYDKKIKHKVQGDKLKIKEKENWR